MLAAMFHDSQSTLSIERVLANDPLHELDLTGQLALHRPMLVARIKRPGAQLATGQRAVAPQDRPVDVGPHHLASYQESKAMRPVMPRMDW